MSAEQPAGKRRRLLVQGEDDTDSPNRNENAANRSQTEVEASENTRGGNENQDSTLPESETANIMLMHHRFQIQNPQLSSSLLHQFATGASQPPFLSELTSSQANPRNAFEYGQQEATGLSGLDYTTEHRGRLLYLLHQQRTDTAGRQTYLSAAGSLEAERNRGQYLLDLGRTSLSSSIFDNMQQRQISAAGTPSHFSPAANLEAIRNRGRQLSDWGRTNFLSSHFENTPQHRANTAGLQGNLFPAASLEAVRNSGPQLSALARNNLSSSLVDNTGLAAALLLQQTQRDQSATYGAQEYTALSQHSLATIQSRPTIPQPLNYMRGAGTDTTQQLLDLVSLENEWSSNAAAIASMNAALQNRATQGRSFHIDRRRYNEAKEEPIGIATSRPVAPNLIPSPVATLGLSSSPSYIDNPGEETRQRAQSTVRWVSLYMSCDEKDLSPYQCLVRKQLELFEANEEDVDTNARGRNRPIQLGQVGIRCCHCKALAPKNRERAAMYYPAKLDRLYQAGQTMASVHLGQRCKHIPQAIRNKLLRLREEGTTAQAGKNYWADGARVLGIKEDEDCLRFE